MRSTLIGTGGRAQRSRKQRGDAFVFRTYGGEVPDIAVTLKAVRRTLDRAGYEWATTHTLHRTVENQLPDAQVDPRVITSVMGHDPATSWSSYVNRNVDVAGIADLMGSSHPAPTNETVEDRTQTGPPRKTHTCRGRTRRSGALRVPGT